MVVNIKTEISVISHLSWVDYYPEDGDSRSFQIVDNHLHYMP